MCALGTFIGRVIKNKFPHIRKCTLVAAIAFSISAIVFGIICYCITRSLSPYMIIAITALGALSALSSAIFYYRKHGKV